MVSFTFRLVGADSKCIAGSSKRFLPQISEKNVFQFGDNRIRKRNDGRNDNWWWMGYAHFPPSPYLLKKAISRVIASKGTHSTRNLIPVLLHFEVKPRLHAEQFNCFNSPISHCGDTFGRYGSAYPCSELHARCIIHVNLRYYNIFLFFYCHSKLFDMPVARQLTWWYRPRMQTPTPAYQSSPVMPLNFASFRSNGYRLYTYRIKDSGHIWWRERDMLNGFHIWLLTRITERIPLFKATIREQKVDLKSVVLKTASSKSCGHYRKL